MQTKLLVATLLVALFALATAKWAWVEDARHPVPADANGPAHESLAYEAAEILQQQGSLSANHQEAMDADSLLNALIKRLTQQIADDSAATNQKISDRTNSINKFEDAVNAAKTYLDELTNQQTALTRKLDEAKTALAGRQGEKSAEQAAIDKENAEQRARLADRITAVENQIALIKKILQLLSGAPEDPLQPESIILDSTQQKQILGLFAGTQWAGKKFSRCYRASESQYSAQTYNKACNGKAPLLTIVKSANGNIFGGFHVVTLDGSGRYFPDANSFLYSFVRSGQTNIVKLPVNTQFGQPEHRGPYSNLYLGPTFGVAQDLNISDKCNANSNSYSNLGYSYVSNGYVYGSKEAKTFLAGTEQFTCADYEVFQLV